MKRFSRQTNELTRTSSICNSVYTLAVIFALGVNTNVNAEVAVAAAAFGTKIDESSTCPGSPSHKHGKCSMVVTFAAPCEKVMFEIHSRLMAAKSHHHNAQWKDPRHKHNGAKYKETHFDGRGWNTVLEGARQSNDGKYEDKFTFSFPDGAQHPIIGHKDGEEEEDECRVVACSESQVSSGLFDTSSNNYCTLRNLYCNSSEEDGCEKVKFDLLEYEEEYVNCHHHSAEKCIADA